MKILIITVLIILISSVNTMHLSQLDIRGGRLANRYPVDKVLNSAEIGSLMDRQKPDDIVYDLTGNAILITIDELTEDYKTFKVKIDGSGLPYVEDPGTGLHYLVVFSRTDKEVGLYELLVDSDGQPIVVDWTNKIINRVHLTNRAGNRQVSLEPIRRLNVDDLFLQ